jgi:hypothetical protein
MPEPRPCRVRSTRPSAHIRALDDLRFIRETMERSASFTAVSGWGQVGIGITVLPAVWIASRQISAAGWIYVWVAEAVLAVAIGVAATQVKARRAGLPLTSGPGRKFVLSFLPPLVAGAVLTPMLHRAGLTSALPGTWLLLYGTGIVTGGAFSVPLVPFMGLCFMALGIGAFFTPACWGNAWMLAGFGGIHVVCGIQIARRHGG